VGDNYNPTDHTSDRVNNTAYDWGSALVEYKRGYSVIVRYGHLYVLYGHLQSLEPTIFVGAPLNAGQRIGKIGRFNDPHVHVEVRNFDSPIGATWLQEGPQREYGFVTYAQVGAAARARHHYNIAQFFDSTVTAWSDDTATAQQTVTGFSPGITNGAQINLGNCTRTFRVNMNLQTVQDTAFGVPIQGLVQGVSNQALLIPPSSVPSV
jgi:murein DD-endopeptidase MepM/ murein hydrolase activator NlpD